MACKLDTVRFEVGLEEADRELALARRIAAAAASRGALAIRHETAVAAAEAVRALARENLDEVLAINAGLDRPELSPADPEGMQDFYNRR